MTPLGDFVGWIAINRIPLLSSLGLVFDIVGAALVAYEVVRQFDGKKMEVTSGVAIEPILLSAEAQETREFADWEKRKYRFMRIGLFFLVSGFILQIVANIFQLRGIG